MRVDSLEMLETLFDAWRKQKRYSRQRVPDALLERAQKAIAIHGLGAVVRATKIDRPRLLGLRGRKRPQPSDPSSRSGLPDGALVHIAPSKIESPTVIPAYTRLPISMAPTRAMVEVETEHGLKLKVFELTPDVASLLTTLTLGVTRL